jgi:selenocysteine-specific translation elongation factor
MSIRQHSIDVHSYCAGCRVALALAVVDADAEVALLLLQHSKDRATLGQHPSLDGEA